MEQRDSHFKKSFTIIFYFLLIFFMLFFIPISTFAQKNYRNIALLQEGTKVTAPGKLRLGLELEYKYQGEDKIIDGIKAETITDKWISHYPNSWIMLDFGQKRRIDKIIITHAGYLESSKYNTADFQLEYSYDKSNWTNIVTPIKGNKESITTHTFSPITTQFVRVYITKPEQIEGGTSKIYEIKNARKDIYRVVPAIGTSRIYEIEVYGTDIEPQSIEYSQPLYPADLFIESVQFIEPSGNQALDGYESGKIQFTLTNRGRGEAQNIQVAFTPLSSAEGLNYTPTQIVELINPKSSIPVNFVMNAVGKIASMSRTFRIQVSEEFGFDADPVRISFETKAFEAPDMKIEKVAINDREEGDAYGNGNSIIEPNESIVVTAYVQNYGAGSAEQVKAKIILDGSDPNLQCPDNGKIFDLGPIASGDYKPVSFYFFTSKRYSGTNIPIKIVLSESKGDYGKTVDLSLKMNIRTQNIVDVNIARIELPKPEIKSIAEIFQSDVDIIPQRSTKNNPDDFAVIIGIENYKYAPKVTYAERDANAFYNYAVLLLGITERNIYYLVNEGATSGEFKKLFEKDGWIAKRATANSNIFVFYSGHGAPDLKDKSSYLIPYDIDPNYASTGFSLNTLYETLGGTNSKSITIFLDACFSGQSRDKEMLLANARPVFIKVESPSAFGKLTVYSASSGAEISSGFPEQKHGIFSYFLLKGLHGNADGNADKKITVGELFNYVQLNVKKTAASLDREQTPTLTTNDKERVLIVR